MGNIRVHVLSIFSSGFFLFLAFGSIDDNLPNTIENTNQDNRSYNAIEDNVIIQHLFGKWQLDSTISETPDEMKNITISSKNIRFREDGKMVLYNQSQYINLGDNVYIYEFKRDGQCIITHIYDYSVKHESTGKQTSKLDYEIRDGKIISYFKWGKNNMEETRIIMPVIKIDNRNLVYDDIEDGKITTYYFSKLKR
jgi:hypothetical protein